MASEDKQDDELQLGPRHGIIYPLNLVYCGECTMPLEYCEFHPNFDKCKAWLEKNLPNLFENMYLNKDNDPKGDNGDGETKEKKRQTRGGRGQVKAHKKKTGPQKVCLSRASRGKRKFVTVVTGLNTFDIDLKVAAKFFGTKFACGSSVTGDDEIVIQGDCKDEIFDLITEKWPEIDEDLIDDLGDQKR